MGPELAAKTAGDLALQGSGWACAVLLGIACVMLFKELRACDKRVAELLTKVIEVTEASKNANLGSATALKGVEVAVSTNAQATQTLSREIEGELRELRHTVGNAATVGNAVAELVRNIPTAIGSLVESVRNLKTGA